MELGSEFGLSLFDLSIVENTVFSYLDEVGMKTAYFDSGRSALRFLMKEIKPDGEVLLPEFICESVIKCFPEDMIRFYRVTERFEADLEDVKRKITKKTKYIYLMHYFGAVQPYEIRLQIKEVAQKQGLWIIEDTTHSLFGYPHTVGDYVIASLRKWMQIPDGGVLLSSKDFESGSLKKQTDNKKAYGMVLKDLFLRGELDCNSEYLDIFVKSENTLDGREDIAGISDLSAFIMQCVDISELVERRSQNYSYLRGLLADIDIVPAIEIDEKSCPLVMPIRIKNRDDFRKYLIENRVFCAVHWPFDGIRESEREQAVINAKELISLPIDQRYGKEHLEYMFELIKSYKGIRR